MAHTPGPWELATFDLPTGPRLQRRNDGSHVVITQDALIAEVAFKGAAKRGQAHTAPDPEGEANARLIAAAPGMLWALQRILEIDLVANGGGLAGNEIKAFAEAAIKRATQ